MLLPTLFISALLPLPGMFTPGFAQGQDMSYFDRLLNVLQSSGFQELVNVTKQINQTAAGQQLLAQLPNGNYTVFAPSDEAIRSIPSYVSNDPELLANYVSYHFVHGDLSNSSSMSSGGGAGGGSGGSSSVSTLTSESTSASTSLSESTTTSSGSTSTETSTQVSTDTSTNTITTSAVPSAFVNFRRQSPSDNITSNVQLQSGVYPNVTLGRTLLNSPDWVMLEGNKSQALAWTRSGENGNVTVLNQISNDTSSRNVTVVDGLKWENLFINRINGYLNPPGNVSTALTAVNASSLQQTLTTVQIPQANGTNTTALDYLQNFQGFTLFAPNNDAFQSMADTLQSLSSNQSAVLAILENHLINGTTLYSPVLASAASSSMNYTSTSGQPLAFSSNETGLFVNGGNGTSAQIVRPDVLVQNGVIHIIDHVLFDTDEDPAAASSAYDSATSVAAQSTTETAVIGANPTSMGESSAQPSSSASSTAPSSTSSESEPSSSPTQSASSTSVSPSGSTLVRVSNSALNDKVPSVFATLGFAMYAGVCLLLA